MLVIQIWLQKGLQFEKPKVEAGTVFSELLPIEGEKLASELYSILFFNVHVNPGSQCCLSLLPWYLFINV